MLTLPGRLGIPKNQVRWDLRRSYGGWQDVEWLRTSIVYDPARLAVFCLYRPSQ